MTSGTYLQSRIIIGDVSYSQGPNGLSNANELSKSLIDLELTLEDLKLVLQLESIREVLIFQK